jgi:menaquinone-specific isochorismate synthase
MSEFLKEFLLSGTLMSLRPGHFLIGWGPRAWTIQPESSERPNFYFPDFFLSHDRPWFTHEQWAEISQNELIRQVQEFKVQEFKLAAQNFHWENPHQLTFEQAFLALKEQFLTEKLFKAVPYIFEISKQNMTQEALIHSLRHILSLPDIQYVYGFWDKSQGLLGVTPELLFESDKEDSLVVHTMACAGTQKREAQENLLHDPKTLKEHRFVVQGIQESLTALGDLQIGNMLCLELPTLSHLVTPIEIKLYESLNFDKLVRALHPTPALGAFPKKEGMEWLKKYDQKIHRHRYGAPAGFLFGAHAACFVAIRNVQWNSNGCRIGAGCGVLSESDQESEWQEIQLKLRSIKERLAL